MRIGGLFSGIGGLEVGLEAAIPGSETVWQCEIDPYCRAVLAHHWPNAMRYDDVTRLNTTTLAPVDIICGGFPCQDVSLAGAGAGLAGARSGLWFEYLRIIDGMRPRFVVIENVLGLVRRGLDVVVRGLEALGYTVEGSRIRAGDVGAPHRRERVFLLAWLADSNCPCDERQPVGEAEGITEPRQSRETLADPKSIRRPLTGDQQDGTRVASPIASGQAMADGDGERQPQPEGRKQAQRRRVGDSSKGVADANQEGLEEQQPRHAGQLTPAVGEAGRPAKPGLVRGADGLSGWLDRARWPCPQGEAQHDWEAPRTVTPRSVPRRTQRVKMLGNAVVPQCAYIVGRRIMQHLETS